MKKCLSILLTLALAVGCLLPSAFAEQKVDLTGKLVIVYTNDVHGYAVTDPSEPAAGYAQVAQYGLDGHTFAAADWLNESLVLAGVDDREAQTLARWITEATGTTVSPSLAGAQGTLYLYRFQKGSV